MKRRHFLAWLCVVPSVLKLKESATLEELDELRRHDDEELAADAQLSARVRDVMRAHPPGSRYWQRLGRLVG